MSMTIGEALVELDGCDWLKINGSRSLTATKYKTRAQLAMLTRDDFNNNRNALHLADVHTRRKKGESFEGFLIRAAEMVRAGHLPTRRVPPLKPAERCACGSETRDLIWNDQLQQRMCRACVSAWMNAAATNDLGQVTSRTQ